MGHRLLKRRLAQVSARLKEVQEELRLVEDQYAQLASDADDLSLRALVAETPAAEHEHREARRHADAMGRHRNELIALRADLTARMDELLDRLKEPTE
ncbi:MAG: hypothetical protein ACKO1X_05540 [Acidimicrobiales bacterium]